MQLAILFWFYKNPELCQKRLALLRNHHPNIKIFGLYGGPKTKAPLFKQKLESLLDNFYLCPERSAQRKWRHGDLMLLDWYVKRGKNLKWSHLAIVQWDMLVHTDLRKLFPQLGKNEIYFSGLRDIVPSLEKRWSWTSPRIPRERRLFKKFQTWIKSTYELKDPLPCCLFIFQIFPRVFFDKFKKLRNPEFGFLEYKLPCLAKAWGLKFRRKDLGVWWYESRGQQPLNALPKEIPSSFIKNELAKSGGWRIFHPVFK